MPNSSRKIKNLPISRTLFHFFLRIDRFFKRLCRAFSFCRWLYYQIKKFLLQSIWSNVVNNSRHFKKTY